MLCEQLPWTRVGTVLHEAVTPGASQAGSNQFLSGRCIEVDSLFIVAPTFLYAFRDN
jgi:hypothetical protein